MTTFSSTFAGGDENPLSEGGNWSNGYDIGNRDLQIVSNRIRPEALATRCYATVSQSFGTVQTVSLDIPTLTDSAVHAGGPLLRFTAPTGRSGYATQANFGGHRGAIVRVDSGTDTIIAFSDTCNTFAGGDSITGKVSGAGPHIELRGGGGGNPDPQVTHDNDGTYASGRVGVVMSNDGLSLADFEMDNFTADFSGGHRLLRMGVK